MTSNKEWLDNLAATDPQALQAWFDAPRGGLDAPHADCGQVDGNHPKDDSDDSSVIQKEPVSLRDCFGILSDSPKCSKILRNEPDSREQLEADVREWVDDIGWLSDKETQVADFIAWLDRQEAITTRQLSDRQIMKECKDWERWCKDAERKCSELQAELEKQTTDYANVIAAQIKQMNELAHDLAESERLREEMREELSIAYDHAHDLLARRDRGLA